MNNEAHPLMSAFERANWRRRSEGFSHLGAAPLALGCETRRVAAEYRWDGMKRGDDARHPRIVFQATLAGAGRFERGARAWEVGAETAFFAVLPSRHVYRLPEGGEGWSFFWFNVGHPFVVGRLAALARRMEPVFALPAASELAAASLMFFERVCRQRFEDAYAEEGALFEWMLAFERHAYELAHPRGEREEMREEARRHTMENLRRVFGVEELARRRGLSRSHYSHRFRGATGLAPAAYVLEVRLTEARRWLRETDAPLKEIAAATGFADAIHFCKAFRRLYHLSPGAYRSQAR